MNLRRKRMILMRDVWYGYNRTASGNPVKLEAAKRLRQLTIYGNAVQSNLPSGYTEVGYIESSGTQYIDTGVCPTNNTKVEVVFENVNNEKFVYGSRSSADDTVAAHAFFASSSSMCFPMFGTYISAVGVSMADNRRHKAEISQAGAYLNGNLIRSYDTMDFTSTLNMFLCGLNQNGNMDSRTFVGKIYSFRVWESGELIQSLVPCKRDSDGAVGMYDTVTGAFLTNSGTGVFTAGAAVTPSPDAPVDIQLCGDRTGNLLDYDVFDNTPEYISDSSVVGCFEIQVPNGIYTLSSNILLENAYAGLFFIADDLPSNFITSDHGVSLGSPRTIEVTAEKLYVCLYWKNGNPNYKHVFTKDDFTGGTYWIMLNEGSEAQPYEPYGYKVSGRVEGVNLLDVGGETSTSAAGVTWTINNDGSVTVSGTPTDYSGVSFPRMKAKPNTIYTLSTNIEIPNVVGVINFYDADNTMVATSTGTNSSSMLQAVSPEGTTNVTVSFKRNINNVAIPETTFYPMLLQGSYTADTIPPYEPYQPPQDFAVYLPQQIAKVGDVADTVVVDFEQRTAELVQNGWVKTFYGTENFGSFVTSVGNGFSYTNSSIYSSNHKDVISNMYTTSYGMFDHSVYVDLTRVNFIDNSFQTANEFKEWVADLYTAGDPLICLLRYATPVTTDITAMQDWDAMPQVKGTVTLTLSAEVEPSGAEAVYYSAERGD